MIELKLNVSKTKIARHWLVYAHVLCNALNFMIFSGGVIMLYTPCCTPVCVGESFAFIQT